MQVELETDTHRGCKSSWKQTWIFYYSNSYNYSRARRGCKSSWKQTHIADASRAGNRLGYSIIVTVIIIVERVADASRAKTHVADASRTGNRLGYSIITLSYNYGRAHSFKQVVELEMYTRRGCKSVAWLGYSIIAAVVIVVERTRPSKSS
jgi:hypothetical protein